MQCQHCGYPVPAGAWTCPRCSRPLVYSAGAGYNNASVPPPPSLAPTQLATGGPPPLAPTQFAGAGGPGAQPPPPPPSPPGWQTPVGPSGPGWTFQPAPPVPQPVFLPVQPQPKSGCSTAAIVVLVVLLVVVCAGAVLGGAIWYTQAHNVQVTVTALSENVNATATAINNNATATVATTQLTPTPYPPYTESNPPSGATFSGTAQRIVTYAQMASQLNSHYQPTELQSIFQVGQKVYLAYHWTNIGYSGYVDMVWYFNGRSIGSLRSDVISTNYGYYDGYSAYTFVEPGQGAVEVYWCSTASCSNRQLAWMRPFSVSG